MWAAATWAPSSRQEGQLVVTLPREQAAGSGLLSLQFRYTLEPTLSGFYLAAFAGASDSPTPRPPVSPQPHTQACLSFHGSSSRRFHVHWAPAGPASKAHACWACWDSWAWSVCLDQLPFIICHHQKYTEVKQLFCQV